MARLGIRFAVLVSICIWAWAEDVVPDLSAVKDMDLYRGPTAGKALLKRNGFVVTRDYTQRIADPYRSETEPHFITADSVHATFHTIFENLLKKTEFARGPEVLNLARTLREAVLRPGPAWASDEARSLAANVLLVGECLLSEDDAGAQPAPEVRGELELINAAQGIAQSPLLQYPVDYTQFKPRGFYTESASLRRYFKAMSWFGNAGLLVRSDAQSLAALLIARTLNESQDLAAAWKKLDAFYTFLLGACDDLTPIEYAGIASGLDASATPSDAIAAFRAAAQNLRNPTINSMALDVDEMPRWRELSKGMRFLGKRYTPDSHAFMKLTLPEVPLRCFPTGLDVMAANGSQRARALIDAIPDCQSAAYSKGLGESVEVLARAKGAAAPNCYALTLKLAEAITAPPIDKAPAFVKGEAYADKNLSTALAAWASVRHAFILHAKQPMIPLCMPPEPPLSAGYVEPNPAFFDTMLALIDATSAAFKSAGADVKRLDALAKIVHTLRRMVDKELAEEPFDKEENDLLKHYGDKIAGLQDLFGPSSWKCLIADVHTCEDTCLEVGTGGAMPIYVAMPLHGVWQLMKGAVYSYFEFKQPAADRLTDEEWRELWETGQIPPLQPWTGSFVARTRDVSEMIAIIANGGGDQDAYYTTDPALNECLRQLLFRPDSRLYADKEKGPWFEWCIALAGKKLGREAAPKLLELMRGSDARVASCAAQALTPLLSADDLPALGELILASDRYRAFEFSLVLSEIQDKKVEDFLLSLFYRAAGNEQRRLILQTLGMKASPDLIPTLLKVRANVDAEVRNYVEFALVRLASYTEDGMDQFHRLSSMASEKQLQAWTEDVKKVVLAHLHSALESATNTGTVVEHDDDLASVQRMVERLRMDEAIPVLLRYSGDRHLRYDLTQTLEIIGTDAAREALVLLAERERSFDRYNLIRYFVEYRDSRIVPLLRRMLTDDTDCIEAAEALQILVPDGPRGCQCIPFPGATVHDLPECWPCVEAWKHYFDPQYVPKPFPILDLLRFWSWIALPICGGLLPVVLVGLGIRAWLRRRRRIAARRLV